MTTPAGDDNATEDTATEQESEAQVPPAQPAYSTPPPEGLPDAEGGHESG
jgi:hypothetical protein